MCLLLCHEVRIVLYCDNLCNKSKTLQTKIVIPRIHEIYAIHVYFSPAKYYIYYNVFAVKDIHATYNHVRDTWVPNLY